MNSIVVVLCLAVAIHAELPKGITDIIDTPGKQYELYKKYIEQLKMPKNEHEELFTGLNIHRRTTKVIDDDSLNEFYWHELVVFAKQKFFKLLNNGKNNNQNKNEITILELENILKKQHIIVALIECIYLGSKNLQQFCLADQLLTYTVLVLGGNNVDKFYKTLNSDKTSNEITKEELTNIQLPTGETVGKDLDILYEELGGNDNDHITRVEFEEYVIQESINDNFRECRNYVTVETAEVDFDIVCLQRELVKYANDDLTEMDISVLFRAVDKDENDKITWKDINRLDESKFTEEKAKQVIRLLDMSESSPTEKQKENNDGTVTEPTEEQEKINDGTVTKRTKELYLDYGEFRSYIRSPTVLVQLERECTVKYDQKKQIECLIDKFEKLCSEGHDPIWMVVPDLDQLITFEIFDTDKNGKITPSELSKIEQFSSKETVTRFINEADNGGDKEVSLKEFNEYVNIPHMVYGTANCLLITRKKFVERGNCFKKEISEIINNFKFFEKTAWNDWFNYYDKSGEITSSEKLDNLLGKSGLATLFVKELGQGGNAVSLFEFTWYVKQKELAIRYGENRIISKLTEHPDEEQIKKLSNELVKWIEGDVTEYDIQQFFGVLLGENNINYDLGAELVEDDFEENVWTKVAPVIRHIDSIDPTANLGISVNFREFWLWLHSDNVGDQSNGPRIKDIFKKECTERKTSQKDELVCYKDTLRLPIKFGVTEEQMIKETKEEGKLETGEEESEEEESEEEEAEEEDTDKKVIKNRRLHKESS